MWALYNFRQHGVHNLIFGIYTTNPGYHFHNMHYKIYVVMEYQKTPLLDFKTKLVE